MRSFTLVKRIAAIALVTLIAIWLGVVANFYNSELWERRSYWPTPARMASIVSTVEASRPEALPGLLDALNSQSLHLRIETSNDNVSDLPTREVDEDLMREYSAALGDRNFTLARLDIPAKFTGPVSFGHRGYRALEFRVGLDDGMVLVVDAIPPLILTAFGLPLGMMAGMVATFVALIALLIMYREIRPLRDLARAVDRIQLGGDLVELPPFRRQSAEIQGLARAFGHLQTRLSQLLRGRMAMIGGISHDVRTYATRLRLRVDLISDDTQRERAIEDIGDMIQLLDDALLSARIGANDMNEELLDFVDVVEREVEHRRDAGAMVELSHVAGLELPVIGDRLALKRIVSNLVDNAVKYGHSAHVRLARDKQVLVMSVEDEGPGIPEDLIDILTEPFVRAEASRGRNTGGAGLGLAIVRNLVEIHGGSITLENRLERGARITVRIPLFKE